MDANDINEGTALEGSDPSTGQPSGSPPDTGAITAVPNADDVDETGKPLPFNEHPKWKSARAAEKELTKILGENELESIEDLVELVKSGKSVVGRGLDESQLEDLIAKATKMEQVEEYWQATREAQQRENETGEEREDRLMRENADLKQKLSGKNALEENKRALDTFQKKTREFVETVGKDLDLEAKRDFEFLMGVDHPFGEIDITNAAQVGKMGKQVQKAIDRIEQRAIKGYIAGKKALVTIGSASTPAVQPQQGIRNFKQARSATLEKVRSLINQ
jgi:hypothetical protein